MNMTNNTILITGGTSGFGLQFTEKLLKLGNTVIITGRNQVKLEETKRRFSKLHTFQSDVSDPEAIVKLYKDVITQFPDLNVLINNAGEMRQLNLQNASTDLYEITREIDINLSGPIRMVQQFLPHLKNKSSASILNVTSGLALVPFPLAPVYGATKAGLRSYTKSLRVQLKNTNVKVFELVAPAANTPLNDKFVGSVDAGTLMEADKLVDMAIKGLSKNTYEIYPGIARVMHIMSRLAPSVIFNQLSKITEKTFSKSELKK